MGTHQFARVCDYLAIARVSLAVSEPATSTQIGRIEVVEHQLDPAHVDWRGDTQATIARHELESIVDDLQMLTVNRSRAKVLLPGVDGGLKQLRSALRLLALIAERAVAPNEAPKSARSDSSSLPFLTVT